MEEQNADQCDGDDVSVEILPESDAGPSSVLKSRKQRRGNLKKQETNSDDQNEENADHDISMEILTDSESEQSEKAKSRLNHHPSFIVVIRQSYLRRLSLSLRLNLE
ncbi:hypothetical protein LINPERPRIM_LOCUS26689 [Linum perenne]